MPAPPRARQPRPPGNPPRSGLAPPYGGRPLSSGHRAPRHRHSHQHRRGPFRLLVVGGLVVATLGAGAWYFLGRSTAEPSQDFFSIEQRFAGAAWSVHFTPRVIQQFRQLHAFNEALDAQALVMEQSIAEFDRLAHTEEGEAADIARASVQTGQDALRAVSDFRDAIVTTNDLTDAQDALDRMDRAVDELDANVKQWNQL